MSTVQSSYSDLVSASISGVTSLTAIPSQISTAILPCKYVRYQGSQIQIATLGNSLGLPTYLFDMVVVIEPVLQNTNIANQTLCMVVADALETFFESIDNILSINISFEINLFNNTAYWTLIAEIEMLGG